MSILFYNNTQDAVSLERFHVNLSIVYSRKTSHLTLSLVLIFKIF